MFNDGTTAGTKVLFGSGLANEPMINFNYTAVMTTSKKPKLFGGACASLSNSSPCTLVAVRKTLEVSTNPVSIYLVNTANKFTHSADEPSDSLTGKITTSALGSVAQTNGGSQSIMVSGTMKTSDLSLLVTRLDGSITNI